MRRRAIGLLTAAILLQAGTVSASAAALCPTHMLDTQSATEAPADWTATQTSQRHALTGFGIFEGKIEDKVERAPTSSVAKGTTRTTTWRFEQATRPVVLACRYAGTSLVYSTPLPDTVRSCTLTSDTRRSVVSPDALRCR
jgi:hypothetical protein